MTNPIIKKRSRISILRLILIYRLLLDIYYLRIVSIDWSYGGLVLALSVVKEFISYCLMIYLYKQIEWKKKAISSYILQVMFIVMIIPLLSFYGMANKSTPYILICSLGFYLTIKLGQANSNRQFNTHLRLSPQLMHGEIIGILFLVLILIYQMKTYGFHPSVLDFINPNVYEIRIAIDGKDSNSFIGYFVTWSYKMICPFVLAYCLDKKKRMMSVFAFIIQLLLYMTNPHKEILFSIVLILGAYYSIKIGRLAEMVLIGFISIIIIDMILYGSKLEIYSSAIMRRLLYFPAEIKYEHFDYFSNTTKLLFSEGKIGKLLGIPYPFGDKSVGETVAFYFHQNNSNSNAGYLAYGYDNLGYLGVLLDSCLVGVVIMYIQRISNRYEYACIGATAVYSFIQLNDLPLQTTLLTGGLGLFIIILFLMACKRKKEYEIELYGETIMI